jgi:light-regulated signal transduction histidine kinase (bacteriophytochrome)
MMDEVLTQINKMKLLERALMKHRAQSKEAYERLTPNYLKAILSVTTLIALISFILLLQELKQRLAAQAQLETRVKILAQTNAELQQIAHVTSHDLQEPLRKIRTFIDALLSKFKDEVPEEAKAMLGRVDKNANYIRDLVADLSDFASLASNDEKKTADIDLNRVLLQTQKDFAPEIQLANAICTVAPLPRVGGYEKQLSLLFKELISNALKFSKEDVPLELTITGTLINGRQLPKDMKFGERNFNVITLYDNGIGFEKEYAKKIFILFQKLHGTGSRYPGKGIGLAICQRIMANHDGFITALADPGIGATFQLYFPVNE